MRYFFRLLGSSKNEVVILRSVALGQEIAAGFGQERSGYSSEVADVIVAAQHIRRKIGLKVRVKEIIPAIVGLVFIAVDKIRPCPAIV